MNSSTGDKEIIFGSQLKVLLRKQIGKGSFGEIFKGKNVF